MCEENVDVYAPARKSRRIVSICSASMRKPSCPCREVIVSRLAPGMPLASSSAWARTLVVDVDSDRLFLPAQAEELAGGIPGARRETINSLHGHDGFLIEAEQMDAILRDFLAGTI